VSSGWASSSPVTLRPSAFGRSPAMRMCSPPRIDNNARGHGRQRCIYSGSPAKRRPSSSLARDSGRRIGINSLMCEKTQRRIKLHHASDRRSGGFKPSSNRQARSPDPQCDCANRPLERSFRPGRCLTISAGEEMGVSYRSLYFTQVDRTDLAASLARPATLPRAMYDRGFRHAPGEPRATLR
jgi:hypothetical protein